MDAIINNCVPISDQSVRKRWCSISLLKTEHRARMESRRVNTATMAQRLPSATIRNGFITTPRATGTFAAKPQPIRVFATALKQPANLLQRRPHLSSAFPTIARLPDKFDALVQRAKFPLHRKPECSYSCLIGLALCQSGNSPLLVGDIYKYIEHNFPFYKTYAPAGWKSCVRHSLSLGHYFRMATSEERGKRKGNRWEIIPNMKEAVQRDVKRFLALSPFNVQSASNALFRGHSYVQPPQKYPLTQFTGWPLKDASSATAALNQHILKLAPFDNFSHLSQCCSSNPTLCYGGTSIAGAGREHPEEYASDPQSVAPQLTTSQPPIAPGVLAALIKYLQNITGQGEIANCYDPIQSEPQEPPLSHDLLSLQLDSDLLRSVEIDQYYKWDRLLAYETFEDLLLSTSLDGLQEPTFTPEEDEPPIASAPDSGVGIGKFLEQLDKAENASITQSLTAVPELTLSALTSSSNVEKTRSSGRKRKRQEYDEPISADPLTLLVNTIIGEGVTVPGSSTGDQESIVPSRKKLKLDTLFQTLKD